MNSNPTFKVYLDTESVGYTLTLLDGKSEPNILFQTDYEYPALAANLGWRGLMCHRGTDGSVPCPHCGREFITDAMDWLDSNCGEVILLPASAINSFPW